MLESHMARMKPNNIFYGDCFSAGYYYRLSDEDKNKTDRFRESQSITTQRDMAHYVVEQGLIKGVVCYKEYYDDDYTGMNFDRPGFQEMMKDLEDRKIDCIVVKDFSRFGRDSDRVKRFLEVDFEQPGKEVRFIAFGDGYDSLYKTPDTGVRMLLFMNEEYSQNQHLKVKLAIRTKQAKGDFIGAFTRYGYQKDPEDKHHLIPDPYPFSVVQRMFRLAYYENLGAAEIAGIFTAEGIEPPAVYKEKQGSNYKCGKRIGTIEAWNPDTVNLMLQDETYAGAVVQGKRRKDTLRGKSKCVPKDRYIVVPDKHEAAVDRVTFDELQKRHKTMGKHVAKRQGLFQGLLVCGDCQHALWKGTDRYKESRYVYYRCRIHKRMPEKCYNNYISEKVLKKIIIGDFNRAIQTVQNLDQVVRRYQDCDESKEYYRQMSLSMERKQAARMEIGRLLDSVERKWLTDLISDQRYEELREKYEREAEDLGQEIQMLRLRLENRSDISANTWIRKLLDTGRITEVTRELLTEMVSKIYVSHDNTVRIIYKFTDELDPFFAAKSSDMPG